MHLDDPELLLTDGWIDGKPVAASGRFAVLDPATLDTIAEVSDLDERHAAQAIAAAVPALAAWKLTSVDERIACILAWAGQIEANAADLARLITAESGKPLAQAQGEAGQCAALLRWFASQAQRLNGIKLPAQQAGQQNYTIQQPVGVVACVTPWNFPAAAVVVKAGAAIVAGCAAIVKPSEETPLIALALAKLAERAGLPRGVLNVLPCRNPAPVGDALCASAAVRMLSFTGSIRVGKLLYAACSGTVKRLTLELGGNAPFIVFEDADLDRALDGAMGARFYNSGQICVGANRYLVHRDIYREFADRLAARVAALKPGSGFDETSDIGPMINRAAVERLNDIVATSQAAGAELLAGGIQTDDESRFFSPTVLQNMTHEMPASRTEVFGPVACLYQFENEAQALRLANDTDAGLAAYVYTRDAERLLRCVEALEAGVVGANSSNIFANDLPFGGIKQSGLGREHGERCLDEYVETKSVCMCL
jgi:succinate-semialdehyde dehydrogenase/glutarate-semialdehyde dehydrogenase